MAAQPGQRAHGAGAVTGAAGTVADEVAGEVAIPFHHDDLIHKLNFLLTCSEEDRSALRAAAGERVQQRYSWDYVTDAYEHLFKRLLS